MLVSPKLRLNAEKDAIVTRSDKQGVCNVVEVAEVAEVRLVQLG
jgi:hypothetical protein